LNRSPHNSLRRQPKTDRGKQRVEIILKAAAEVFLEVGYEAATTHAIALRANTAIGSLYQFFPDKLAIFHALELRHMESVSQIIAKFLAPETLDLSLEQMMRKLVNIYADYFENPIPRIVYLQYFVAPEMFQLFDESFERDLIRSFANFLRIDNPNLSIEKSELLAEVCQKSYNSLLLIALRSDRAHRHKLYLEIGDLLIAYLKPYVGINFKSNSEIKVETTKLNLHDRVMVNKVMKCHYCNSEKISKNGRKQGKQRYICKDCGKQFAEYYELRGYGDIVKQKCLELHSQGMSFRQIEKNTGVSHNTVIQWVKQKNK
jgi:AcrR family transcriptional regulator/transposase-like protein